MPHAPLSRSVSANIRAEMARRGLTQGVLAEALGLSRPSISNRFRGVVPWTVDELAIVADGLGIDPADLLRTHP